MIRRPRPLSDREIGAFYLTSFPDRPHVRRLERDPRAGICIDVERPARPDGERPNQQVRAVGTAELSADERGLWTRRITRKYVTGAVADERAEQRAAQPRTVIRLAPARLVAVASV